MSDPSDVVDAISRAEDTFEHRGHGRPDFVDEIDTDEDWRTQLTKSCRYLKACRVLREASGYNGAVIELAFGAIERSVEAYLLWDTNADLRDFHDHEAAYERAATRGLFGRDTARRLQELYGANRTEQYYGGAVPTRQQEDSMYDLAIAVHSYVVGLIRTGGVCVCTN